MERFFTKHAYTTLCMIGAITITLSIEQIYVPDSAVVMILTISSAFVFLGWAVSHLSEIASELTDWFDIIFS